MDYAIARRIVDLHSHQEEAIERTYSLEDIQRYITFARLFKPKVLGSNLLSRINLYVLLTLLLQNYSLFAELI